MNSTVVMTSSNGMKIKIEVWHCLCVSVPVFVCVHCMFQRMFDLSPLYSLVCVCFDFFFACAWPLFMWHRSCSRSEKESTADGSKFRPSADLFLFPPSFLPSFFLSLLPLSLPLASHCFATPGPNKEAFFPLFERPSNSLMNEQQQSKQAINQSKQAHDIHHHQLPPTDPEVLGGEKTKDEVEREGGVGTDHSTALRMDCARVRVIFFRCTACCPCATPTVAALV